MLLRLFANYANRDKASDNRVWKILGDFYRKQWANIKTWRKDLILNADDIYTGQE